VANASKVPTRIYAISLAVIGLCEKLLRVFIAQYFKELPCRVILPISVHVTCVLLNKKTVNDEK